MENYNGKQATQSAIGGLYGNFMKINCTLSRPVIEEAPRPPARRTRMIRTSRWMAAAAVSVLAWSAALQAGAEDAKKEAVLKTVTFEISGLG